MTWAIYASTYLSILMNKIKTATANYDIQKMIAPLMWCFDTYPILSVVLLLVISAYAIPICIFLLFSIVTFATTFIGFLILEGAIIAVAFVVLLSVLSTLTITLAVFFFTCWTMYLIISQLCSTAPVTYFANVQPNDNLLNNNNLNRSFHRNEE